MKFSYLYLKKLVPKIKNKKQLEEVLNEKVFEVDSISGDTFDISVSPNRYADASGHWGLAKEISSALDIAYTPVKVKQLPISKEVKNIVAVKDKRKCRRYMAGIFFNINVISSPKNIRETLKSCGIRAINNVVDIMNYVMIETGQPLHAFDLEKVSGKVVVRLANKGEEIRTIDGQHVVFAGDELVIADNIGPIAIAGIKGGSRAVVTEKTKKIFVESALFDSSTIYTTSRNIGITTDASLRFSRKLNPKLSEVGIKRARELLEKYADAKLEAWTDTHKLPFSKHIILFDMNRFWNFIGFKMSSEKVLHILNKLGFKIIIDKGYSTNERFFVEAPELRIDIEEFEDVAEEVVRMFGVNNIKPSAPTISNLSAKFSEFIYFIDKVKDVLVKDGFYEIYLSSFLPSGYAGISGKDVVGLENYPSANYSFLRPSLEAGFIEASRKNLRHTKEIKIFEVGKVFSSKNNAVLEHNAIGIGVASIGSKDVELFVKRAVVYMLKALGISDWVFVEKEVKGEKYAHNSILDIVISNKSVGWISYLSLGDENLGYAELNADLLLDIEEGEYEYTEISRFPASERDISIIIDRDNRIGEVVEEIALTDEKVIRDVALIDEYEGKNIENNKISITFRIIFQLNDRTLKNKEIDLVMKKIKTSLENKFNAKVR